MPLYLQLLHTAFATELGSLTPIVSLLLAIGLLTAIFQAAFQIEDTAFSLLPKTIAMLAIPLLGGIAMLHAFGALAVFWISHEGELVRASWS
jgi:flagellar biosynthesis protein FliQ